MKKIYDIKKISELELAKKANINKTVKSFLSSCTQMFVDDTPELATYLNSHTQLARTANRLIEEGKLKLVFNSEKKLMDSTLPIIPLKDERGDVEVYVDITRHAKITKAFEDGKDKLKVTIGYSKLRCMVNMGVAVYALYKRPTMFADTGFRLAFMAYAERLITSVFTKFTTISTSMDDMIKLKYLTYLYIQINMFQSNEDKAKEYAKSLAKVTDDILLDLGMVNTEGAFNDLESFIILLSNTFPAIAMKKINFKSYIASFSSSFSTFMVYAPEFAPYMLASVLDEESSLVPYRAIARYDECKMLAGAFLNVL